MISFSDIDECLKPKACGSNAFCTNSYGNYTCTCQEGFQGNPYDGVSIILHSSIEKWSKSFWSSNHSTNCHKRFHYFSTCYAQFASGYQTNSKLIIISNKIVSLFVLFALNYCWPLS